MIQPDDLRLTQLQATNFDCSKQYSLRKFSSTRLQNCNEAPSAIEYTRTFASVFIGAKVKIKTAFRCSATIQKTPVFCALGAYDKKSRHDRMDWHNNTMPLPKQVDPNDCKYSIQNLKDTDSAE